jgi:hypothetical protein
MVFYNKFDQLMQGAFAGVTEWGMANIVCQADSLHQIRIDEKIIVQKRDVFIIRICPHRDIVKSCVSGTGASIASFIFFARRCGDVWLLPLLPMRAYRHPLRELD